MAKLYFEYGCMGAGKSLWLLATANNLEEQHLRFLILKSEIDTRDGADTIKSRAGLERECVSIDSKTNIKEVVSTLLNVSLAYGYDKLKWILVDEAQFLTPEQVDQLGAIVDELDINVKCYGLRTDFKTHLFPGSQRLFEIADDIKELISSCRCGNKTIFNARIDSDGNPILDGEQIQVGGDEVYRSMCRKCFQEKVENPLYQKNKEENNED